MNSKSQEQKILAILKSGKSITPLEALNSVGSLRLGARIFNLKQAGHKIVSERKRTIGGKYVACYSLAS